MFEPRQGQRFGSSPTRSYSLWVPHSLILNGHLQRLKRPRRDADHSPSSSRLKISGAIPPVPHCGFREWTWTNLLFESLTGSHTLVTSLVDHTDTPWRTIQLTMPLDTQLSQLSYEASAVLLQNSLACNSWTSNSDTISERPDCCLQRSTNGMLGKIHKMLS